MTEPTDAIDPLMLLFVDPAAADDPTEAYETLRTQCPVARTPGMMGDDMSVWVSNYEYALWALKHPEVFSSEGESINIGQQHDLIPLQIDPPLHTKYRRFLAEWFNTRAINPLEPEVRRLVNELIDGFVDTGACDFHEDFATPLPSEVFLAMMGLPQSDLPMFLKWRDDIIRPKVDLEDAEAVRVQTGAEITAYFDAQIEELRAHPREGFWSALVNSNEFEGRALTREELLGMAFLLILGGLDTVTATLDCMIEYLALHPDHRRQLIENPAITADAAEEMLRALTPVQVVPRRIKADAELGGIEVKAGDSATIVLGAANLDPGMFPNPNEVDFNRPRTINFAFGGGPHLCLGINLARLELRVALEEWHKRIPDYRIAEGVTITHSPGIRQADSLPLVW
ncbi:MAG: cytochrome P450 [Acidimicrobiia bacterium]